MSRLVDIPTGKGVKIGLVIHPVSNEVAEWIKTLEIEMQNMIDTAYEVDGWENFPLDVIGNAENAQ